MPTMVSQECSAALWLIRYREAIILTASARLARCHVTVPMTAAIRIQRRTKS
jgi:hypothetical protein